MVRTSDTPEFPCRRPASRDETFGDATLAELSRYLELQFESITGRAPEGDPEVSAELATAYPGLSGAEIVRDRLKPFMRSRRRTLSRLYDAYVNDPDAPPIMRCSVSLLVLERLERDRFTLRTSWPAAWDQRALSRLALVWGVAWPS